MELHGLYDSVEVPARELPLRLHCIKRRRKAAFLLVNKAGKSE